MDTVRHVRRLEPYYINREHDPVDPFVHEIIQQTVPAPTIDALFDYTRGMYSLDLHYASFNKYIRPTGLDELYWFRMQNNPHFQRAFQHVEDVLSPYLAVTPIPTDQLDRIKWWNSSAAGFGYIGKRRDNYMLARRNATRALYQFEYFGDDYRFVPFRAFARTQLALRANPKVRHVWGSPFHSLLLEGCTAQPITEQLLISNTPIYIGRDVLKNMPHDIRRILDNTCGQCYCIDWSCFDSSANRGILDWCFDMLEKYIEFQTVGDRFAFAYARKFFVHKPVVMPDGHLFYVSTGVPSGSYFTQIIDSIVNLVYVYALQSKFFGTFAPTYVLGDDSIFAVNSSTNYLSQMSDWMNGFGLTMNVEKSLVTPHYSEVSFLGHNFYGSSVTRDEFTLLSLALFPEEQSDDPVMSAVRTSSLLYDSGFNSTAMYNLLKILVAKHHIDDLTVTLEGIRPIGVTPPFSKLFLL